MWRFLRSISLTKWILISMVTGILIGWLSPETGAALKPLSTIFLRLIKSIIVPLLFATLVVGIAGHGDDLRRVGRLAWKSLLYFEVMTTIALFIGLGAVHLTKPGIGVVLPPETESTQQIVANRPTLASTLEHTFPQSFFEGAARNEVLQVVVFTIIFAIALMKVQHAKPKAAMLGFCEGLAETMFKFTGIVMLYAPIGIGAAMAVTVSHSGIGVLKNLAVLVLTLYGALIAFALVALLPAALIARVPIRRFARFVKEPALIAFATTSSDAALPKALENMEKFGVSRRVAAFVLPTGYSFNLDGSTLYLSLAALFVAQAAGVDLSFGEQLLMMLTLMLTSKGVAAVPRASLVILAGTLASFNLPLAGIAVILGVDELMDMARTTVNLVGNCLATAIMGRWEGEFDPAGADLAAANAELEGYGSAVAVPAEA
jgi:proton glutamate symport protein